MTDVWSPAPSTPSSVSSRHGLRIAYLSGSPRIATRDDAEVSGPRAHVLGLIDALRADGHTVDEFILGDRLRADVSAPGSRRLVSGGRPRQLALDAVRLTMRWVVARRARSELPGHYDLVYERYALFQQLGRSFQRRGAPWVVETNAVISQEARHERDALALQRLAGRLERRTYQQADLVVCVSDRLRDLLVEQAGVPADRIAVIPNGVDSARFTATGQRAGDILGTRGLVVGFVGFVTERQGLDELIRAVAVLRRRGTPVRAVIVGDGPDRARLLALTRAEHVTDAVQFPGQVPWTDVPSWIDSFSVGYSGQRGVGGMPMYHSPLKLYEYLAMARPVVASRHRDAERVLDGPRAGWTFPAGDEDALVHLLTEVAALSPDELSAYGDRGRELVQEHHSWDARREQLLEELRQRDLIP